MIIEELNEGNAEKSTEMEMEPQSENRIIKGGVPKRKKRKTARYGKKNNKTAKNKSLR